MKTTMHGVDFADSRQELQALGSVKHGEVPRA
jgi:hypothetical protein